MEKDKKPVPEQVVRVAHMTIATRAISQEEALKLRRRLHIAISERGIKKDE